VVLEKVGSDGLDRSRRNEESITHSQGGQEYPTHSTNKEV